MVTIPWVTGCNNYFSATTTNIIYDNCNQMFTQCRMQPLKMKKTLKAINILINVKRLCMSRFPTNKYSIRNQQTQIIYNVFSLKNTGVYIFYESCAINVFIDQFWGNLRNKSLSTYVCPSIPYIACPGMRRGLRLDWSPAHHRPQSFAITFTVWIDWICVFNEMNKRVFEMWYFRIVRKNMLTCSASLLPDDVLYCVWPNSVYDELFWEQLDCYWEM